MSENTKLKSLLIVDDEKDLAEVIKEIAEDHFEKIFICNDGQEALKFLAQHHKEISVILSDISMPGLSGDQMLQRLRGQGILAPLVFLTGNASKEVAIQALKLGASDFLEKPFSADHLVRTLQLAVEIEEHKKNLYDLEKSGTQVDPQVLRSEIRTLGIKQAARSVKKVS